MVYLERCIFDEDGVMEEQVVDSYLLVSSFSRFGSAAVY
jgi:hypothetical protein